MQRLSRLERYLVAGGLVLYLLVHLLALTKLPVFADESIYIRWAQLIMDEPWRYLFFALNDGKTPLLVWLFVPFQYLIPNPLAAARIVSVVAGLAQAVVFGVLIKKLGGKQVAIAAGVILSCVLPFWYFYAQMALMDTLLTLWLSLVLLITVHLYQTKKATHDFIWTVRGGIFLGLAFWTKLPAVLFIPPIFVFALTYPQLNSERRVKLFIYLSGVSIIGGCLFLLLKLNPAFSQLFARGGDFLYPISSLLTLELWWRLPGTIWALVRDLGAMITWPVLLAPAIGLMTKKRVLHARLLLAWLAFAFPILLLGKVVYLRYYLPGMVFSTVSAAMLFESLYLYLRKLSLIKQAFFAFLLVQVMAMTLVPSLLFITMSLIDPDQLSLPRNEFVQYLGEWSSGHGVKQTIDMLAQASKSAKVAVATEGYFGTLPDGMLLYLHNMDVHNIWLEGIGQPVESIPASFWADTQRQGSTEYWLVVNSHRMKIKNGDIKLIAQFCRPKNAPCLQVWDISALKPEAN